jgi:hypothetical protein
VSEPKDGWTCSAYEQQQTGCHAAHALTAQSTSVFTESKGTSARIHTQKALLKLCTATLMSHKSHEYCAQQKSHQSCNACELQHVGCHTAHAPAA